MFSRSIIGLVFICLLHYSNFSQNSNIKGTVYDSLANSTIASVEIIAEDNSVKTFTDENGFFSLSVKRLPVLLQLRHISYLPTEVFINKKHDTLRISLTSKSVELLPVEISTNNPVQVMADKRYHIMDYEFHSDKMIVLAYENQSFFSPVLLLINQNGDTLFRLEISKPLKLCKDFSGKVILYGKSGAYTVNVDSNRLFLSDPIDREGFDAINDVIIGQSGSYYYLRKYFNNNQALNYYNYEETKDKLNCFRTIIDEDNLIRNQRGYYFDNKEEDIRFQQLIMLKPVYAPLVRINDTLVLFNFLESIIETYNTAGDPIGKNYIVFHEENGFAKMLLLDEVKSRIYFLYKRNGLSTLKEIDKDSGKIYRSIQVPEFVFIEKIRVNNGHVFFLYKDKYNQEYKKLYKLKI